MPPPEPNREFRRLREYLASLPAGLDSYSGCTQKGAVVRTFLSGAPLLRDTAALPAPVRDLVAQRPLATAWIPEVHATALYLALADTHYPREGDFLAYCARRNGELLRSPMYRALLAIGSPTMMFQAMKAGWPLFHRGTTLALVEKSPGKARIRLAFPPLVVPELIARAYGSAFFVAAEATRLVHDCASELVDFQRDSATYEVSWRSG